MIYVPEEQVIEVISGHTFQTSSARGAVRLADVEVPAPGRPGAERARLILEDLILKEYVRIKLRVFDRRAIRTADVWRHVDGAYEYVNAIIRGQSQLTEAA